MYDALEPTIRTVRTEKTFNVTYQDPNGAEWKNLKRFRQLLLVGTGDEPWIQDAIAKVRAASPGPGVYRAYDIWARGQQATIILAAPDQGGRGRSRPARRHQRGARRPVPPVRPQPDVPVG